MSALKQELYKQCLDYVQKRMDAAQLAIEEAQKASNDDTKSSAGDKYETGRAMMQQETDRNRQQLAETNKLKIALNLVSPAHTSYSAETGSLVITDHGNFYIAISAGVLNAGNDIYFAVSPASPIGLAMKGKKTGENFILNGKLYSIKMVI
jgi:transcription elongation GreA/GreB family factor